MSEEKKMGAPPKYRADYHPQQAMKFALTGMTDEQMAAAFDIHPSTIYDWKNKFSDFSESIKAGKEIADANVASTLYKRAIGHKEKRKLTFKLKAYDEKDRLIDRLETVEVEDYSPPEVSAIIFWLKNRQPQLWRDKKEVEYESKGIDTSKLSDATLDDLERALLNEETENEV